MNRAALRDALDRAKRHEIRELMEEPRLTQYGPMLIEMFDPRREYKLDVDFLRHTSVTSTACYEIVVDNKLHTPTIKFTAVQHAGDPENGLTRPQPLLLNLLRNANWYHEDISSNSFVDVEDWFTHTLTGAPVDHGRHANRWRRFIETLPEIEFHGGIGCES